ncbi:kinase-like domain-containing protein [Cokeromyces recurvatus]|uniref:kinase-like domain-containing protein n=1 Tax=Cokeromyces recurvatus TaxID=90255 RepID=UPI00221FEDB7|nr:kinase-like domain-containing protein [Cokeromyces recurvatus]KAI7903533.1 kinase-like domain-containing protein [Cokeromyces recurvatus]
MIYIQVNADLSYFIPVIMSFKPGLLLYPNQQTKPERTITVTTTSMLIGYGSQAEVSLAYDMAQPRYQLACRKTKKSIYPNTIKAFQLETEILKSNKHANVLSMVAQYSDDPNDAYIYSFFPLYTGGTLYERMMRKGLLKEKDATFIVKQVLSGLHYIHKKDIIHFDVKTENILLSSYGHRPRAVISDFGLAIYKPRINEKHLNYYYGTPSNTSPEMFDNQGFDEKVDCWAAGIMFYYMLSGIHPFIKDIDSENNVKKAILNSQLDLNMKELAHVSNIAKDLISNLLVKDPKERYSCYQGLQATLLYWNWQKDDNAVLEDFKHERYLWFHDEDYNDPTLDSTDGQHPDDIEDEVERIRRLRSTENIKRRITLQSNDIDMIYSEDIRKSTYEQSQFNEILKVFSKKETGSVGNIIFSQQ